MIVLKEFNNNTIDASAKLNNFQLDTSGMFYAVYCDDEYAIPVVGLGIDDHHSCSVAPLVLQSNFGLTPVWAMTYKGKHFKGVVIRGDL